MPETPHQRHPLTNASLRRAFGARSRTSSASSLDSDYVGHLEPTTTSFRPIIFNASAKHRHHDPSGVDPLLFETPPDSGAENNASELDSDFDDKRLPALRDRRSSSPGLGGGEPVDRHVGHGRRRTLSEIEGIKVELESVKERGQKTGQYVLKVDDELRELLAAGAREQRREEARKGGKGRRKRRFGDLVFTQRFTAFDRGSPETEKSPYRGFFVLMWLGVVILMMKIAAENYRYTGKIFGVDILSIMFRPTHLFDCLLMDATMFYGSTLWNVPLQRAVQNGTLSWNRSGWILQSIWQLCFISFLISYTLYKEWPWIQTVFLVLHTIVMLMKQHSYAFYNGYLSEVSKRRTLLEKQLEQLKEENPAAVSSAVEMMESHEMPRRPRRRSSVGLDLTNLPEELSPKQAAHFATVLKSEIDACDMELSLEATNSPNVTYPANLTYWNYLEYIHFPTVVYELAYPRTSGINWSYVAEKTVATFGVLGIMIAVSQQSIYPVVMYTHTLHSVPIQDRLREFPWILLKLVFPFMMEYLCVWYLIWELILNLLAELTRFSDRGFYRDWWNSTTWDAFARDWNVPVHNFLLRHVYHSSISTFQLSREAATLVTFGISAVVHELVMWCIFGKLRGYLLCGQMSQLPLVQLSRTRWLKGQEVLGNVLFWVGIWTGPSFLCAIYLVL